MNKKSKNLLVSILILLIVIILLDLVFDLRKLVFPNKENYLNFDEIMDSVNNSNDLNITDISPNVNVHVKSIISKKVGKIINVESVDISPPTRKIIIKFDDKSLVVLPDGTYGLGLSNKHSNNQQFELKLIINESEYMKVIPPKNLGMGMPISDSFYPFYVIRSFYDRTKCLQYDSGNISIRPIANYDSIKWDISYDTVDHNSTIKTHNSTELLNALSSDLNVVDPTKDEKSDNGIKINLNLGTETLNKLIGSVQNGDQSAFSNMIDSNVEGFTNYTIENRADYHNSRSECNMKDWLPKKSIKSLCSGCNPDDLV